MKITLGSLAAVFFLAYFLYAILLNAMGQALVREDNIKPSDAIVVLAGDSKGERLMTGIDLFKQGYGKMIIFWGGQLYWKFTYAELMLHQLKEAGIPEDKIVWSDETLSQISTNGEALVNFRSMKENNVRSFILVTSPYHTRRAAYVYEPIVKKNGMKMYVYPSADTSIRLTEWWKDRNSAKMVYYEWNKRIYYWLF